MRMSGRAMTGGAETVDVAGALVRVFGVTVADCRTDGAYCRPPRVVGPMAELKLRRTKKPRSESEKRGFMDFARLLQMSKWCRRPESMR